MTVFQQRAAERLSSKSCSTYSTLSSWLLGCHNAPTDCQDTDWIPTAIKQTHAAVT